MEYVRGTPRKQLVLFSERLDDIVEEENPVRFIDAYVENLELEKLGFKVRTMKTGRPPYRAELMLKIYIYGYLNKIRSSRRLEKECKKNIEMIWLTEQLAPDFKTIADFRKDNAAGLKGIFREFLQLCKKLNLIEYQTVAIDGTKMRAQNSSKNVFRREAIEEIEKNINRKIEEYMNILEQNDGKEGEETVILTEEMWERIRKLKKQEEKIDFVKEIFAQNPELEKYYSSDPDCRPQKDHGRTNLGYNSQIVVDDKHKLIVENDVTNEHSDQRQLKNMVDHVKEGKKELEIEGSTRVVADAGYYNEGNIVASEKGTEIETYVSNPRDIKRAARRGEAKQKVPTPEFEKEKFKYDTEKDTFTCPKGNVSKNRRRAGKGYSGLNRVTYTFEGCQTCCSREQCTTSSQGRSICVPEQIKEFIEYRKRVHSETGRRLIQKRKELVEHPFGTLKRNMGYSYFMQRGYKAVKAEFSFISFIYNLKRAMKIIGMKQLLQALN